jgi:NIPSNAP
MAKYDFKIVAMDFKIVAMWESKTDEGLEFVYLLKWPDEQTMTARWEKFLADPEWSEIKRRTRQEHGRSGR